MGHLRLICGPAGSGKTYLVLDEVARAALGQPLPTPEHPPLLVIVPEQQALQIERGVFARMTELQGSPAAAARVRVMSLTRLAGVLAERLGLKLHPLSDLGRRLAAWRALGSDPLRSAEADALARLFAEFGQHGLTPADLEQRQTELQGTSAGETLSIKLTAITAAYRQYTNDCEASGHSWQTPVSLLGEMLERGAWPQLAATTVWVDGFAGFTPPELGALQVLLASCSRLNATLLIDRERLDGPAPADFADWYQPTRDLHSHWLHLAQRTDTPVAEVWLDLLRRWPKDHPLHHLARQTAPGTDPPTETISAVVCPTERLEVDYAVAEIQRLVAGGLRYCEVSIVTRSLKPYAELLAARLNEARIPHFLDRPRPLAAHPVTEYFRTGLRLALGLGTPDDLYSLLKTEVLCPADKATGYRDIISALEHHARRHGIRLSAWFGSEDWPLPSKDEADETAAVRLAQLNNGRRELLQPLVKLMAECSALVTAGATAGEILATVWQLLLPDELQAGLIEDAADYGDSFPNALQLAQQVLKSLAQLVAELSEFSGGQPVTARELTGWVDQAVESLEAAAPPPTLDSVLITEIERGRQHQINATILLGLAEDLWPPPLEQTPLLSDAERELLNDGPMTLVSGGSAERAGREAFFALVAATRPSQSLLLSRPAADTEGRLRQPSPFYSHYCSLLRISEASSTKAAYGAGVAHCGSITELTVSAAQSGTEDRLNEAAATLDTDLLSGLQPALQSIDWSRQLLQRTPGAEPRLPVSALLPESDGQPVLSASASRLECFAACPFKHYARYWLKLDEDIEPVFDNRAVGSFYHGVLEAAVNRLNTEHYDWINGDELKFSQAISAALGQLQESFARESDRERASHVGDRASLLLGHRAESELTLIRDGNRVPRLTEVRFGDRSDATLPPVVIELDNGQLLVGGLIDRLDVGADGLARVVDYKLTARRIDWGRFLAGEQVQLFVYLLAIDGVQLSNPAGTGETILKPAGAAYLHIEPQWDKDSGTFKPELVPPQYRRINAVTRDLLDNSLVPQALVQARRVLAELGGRLLAGDWAPWPFSWNGGKQTACVSCGFRPVCRFDPVAGGNYRPASTGTRMQFQQEIATGRDFTNSANDARFDLDSDAREAADG